MRRQIETSERLAATNGCCLLRLLLSCARANNDANGRRRAARLYTSSATQSVASVSSSVCSSSPPTDRPGCVCSVHLAPNNVAWSSPFQVAWSLGGRVQPERRRRQHSWAANLEKKGPPRRPRQQRRRRRHYKATVRRLVGRDGWRWQCEWQGDYRGHDTVRQTEGQPAGQSSAMKQIIASNVRYPINSLVTVVYDRSFCRPKRDKICTLCSVRGSLAGLL